VPDGYSRAVRGGGGVHTSERDAELLLVTSRQLDDSEFYAAGASVTAADARHRLRSSAAGTFVVRDSADPAHLYSLSVRTARRVTAIRIVYDQQRFRLDSDPQQVDSLKVVVVLWWGTPGAMITLWVTRGDYPRCR